jgi:hypothetical protein
MQQHCAETLAAAKPCAACVLRLLAVRQHRVTAVTRIVLSCSVLAAHWRCLWVCAEAELYVGPLGVCSSIKHARLVQCPVGHATADRYSSVRRDFKHVAQW